MAEKLIYLFYKRPDISYAVVIVGWFMHNPQVQHMEAVFWILRYLNGSLGKSVMFRRIIIYNFKHTQMQIGLEIGMEENLRQGTLPLLEEIW